MCIPLRSPLLEVNQVIPATNILVTTDKDDQEIFKAGDVMVTDQEYLITPTEHPATRVMSALVKNDGDIPMGLHGKAHMENGH